MAASSNSACQGREFDALVTHWVEYVGGSELLGRLKLVLVDVDGEDARGAGHLGRLDHCEADRAQAKGCHRRASLDTGRVAHRADARRHAAAEHAHRGKVRSLVHLGDGYLGGDRVLAEGRAPHEVVIRHARLRVDEAASAVWHHALSLRGSDRRAQVCLRRRAEDAIRLLALRRVARNDVIARSHRGHALANRLDDAAGLMTQNGREEALGVTPFKGVQVGVADGVRHHLHSHLAWARRSDSHTAFLELVDAHGDDRVAHNLLAAPWVAAIGDGTTPW